MAELFYIDRTGRTLSGRSFSPTAGDRERPDRVRPVRPMKKHSATFVKPTDVSTLIIFL